MHAVLMDSLEEYLAGTLDPVELRDIEAHLSTCSACREEVEGMRQVSLWMSALKPDHPIAPPPNFYARVMQEVGNQPQTPTFASLFALDFAFGRRVAFACLLTLAVLGSYLVTRETGEPATLSPEIVMAQQDAPAGDANSAHEAMLATLSHYEP